MPVSAYLQGPECHWGLHSELGFPWVDCQGCPGRVGSGCRAAAQALLRRLLLARRLHMARCRPHRSLARQLHESAHFITSIIRDCVH